MNNIDLEVNRSVCDEVVVDNGDGRNGCQQGAIESDVEAKAGIAKFTVGCRKPKKTKLNLRNEQH